MTIGFGFDVSRPDTSELLTQVGLDPAAVRAGRTPISDEQMNELFDLTLVSALAWAHERIPGFNDKRPEQQSALLELILWLGPDGSEGIFRELEELSLPLTHEPLEPSPWFDVVKETAIARRASAVAPTSRATEPAPRPDVGVAGWARSIGRSVVRARRRHRSFRPRTTFESFGLLAELASDDRELHRAAQVMLPPGWRAVAGLPSVRFGVWTDGSITVNGALADRPPHREASLLKLGAVVRHHLAMHAPALTFVHAGVVDIGGCGIVIPGYSNSGKSTLVAESVRLGARYVSDEYAVLDPAGLVQPFAKPLSIRAGTDDPLGQLVPVPDGLVAEEPVRAGLVVITSYAPGVQWQPTVRSRAEGALTLLQHTVSARLRPGSALSATSRLARGAVFLAGQRGEARETARALLEIALLQSRESNRFGR
jgi:hypothetical protein